MSSSKGRGTRKALNAVLSVVLSVAMVTSGTPTEAIAATLWDVLDTEDIEDVVDSQDGESSTEPDVVTTDHVIRLDPNGGTIAEGYTLSDVEWTSTTTDGVEEQDGEVALPTGKVLERDGYEFVGWSTTTDGEDIVERDILGHEVVGENGDPVVEMPASFVPDMASFDLLEYTYDSDEDGKITDDEHYSVAGCERDGVLTLFAQWEELPEEETSDETEDSSKPVVDETSSDTNDDSEDVAPVADDDNETAATDDVTTSHFGRESGDTSSVEDEDQDVDTDPTNSTEDDETDTNLVSRLVSLVTNVVTPSTGDDAAESSSTADDEDTSQDAGEGDDANAPPAEVDEAEDEADETATVELTDEELTDLASTEDVVDGSDLTTLTAAPRMSLTALRSLSPTLMATEPATATTSEGDGSKIEQLSIEWRTADTPSDDDDDSRLLVTPTTNNDFSIQYRINFAVSGQHDYAAGELMVTVPKDVVCNRSGNVTGTWTLSVPEAPDGKALFAYTETDDSFVITNTRRVSAASQGMFELSLHSLVPIYLNGNPDGYTSDPLTATLELVTEDGSTLSMTSNELTASFDTSAKVTGAGERGDGWYVSYPSDWNQAWKPEDDDDYVYVKFYSWAYTSGNQTYSMDETHHVSSPTLGDGVILGVSSNGRQVTGDGTSSITVPTTSNESSFGTGHYTMVYAAFKKPTSEASLLTGTSHTATDTTTYTLTSTDDGEVTTATASGSQVVTIIPFELPAGSFHFFKWGGGTYQAALNQLVGGSDVTVSYSMQDVAYQAPWTWVDTDGDGEASASELGQRSVDHVVTDDVVGLQGTALTDADYDIDSVTITNITGYAYQQFDSPGYAFNGYVQTGGWGYVRSGAYTTSAVTVEALVGDIWQTVTTTARAGQTVSLPAGTSQYRLSLSSNAPLVTINASCRVTLHPTDAVKAVAQTHIDNDDRPSATTTNHATAVWSQDGTDLGAMEATGSDTLTGLYQAAGLSKSVSYTNDTSNRQVRLRYSVTQREQSNAQSRTVWDAGVAAGVTSEEDSGTFFDLLPRGVTPDTTSVTVSGGTVTGVTLTDDYKGSGRTLMTVTCDLNASPTWVSGVLSGSGLGHTHTMSFDATYSWESMVDYGRELTNVVAFESGSAWVGNVRGYEGEPDDPTAGSNYASASAVSGVESVMTDLDDDRDDPAFTYAKTSCSLDVDISALTSLSKRVAVNGSGTYSDGLGTDELNVYESGTYSYRLRVENDETTRSTDMVLYDALEAYVPTSDKDDAGDVQWRGDLVSVDVSQLEDMGIAPVVYYSTTSRLTLDDTSDRSDNDLTNTSIWSTTAPPDLSTVTAIAIDARKATDGSDYTLDVSKSIVAYVRMTAPRATAVDADDTSRVYDTTLSDGETEGGDSGWTGGAHAYNNSVLTSTSISADTGARSEDQLIRNDYTKVGLKPFKIVVTKAFSDSDDNDGKRPESVTVHITAGGEDTGKSATLDEGNGWRATFDDLPATDERGQMVSYGVTEDAVDGYSANVTTTQSDTELDLAITNSHTPETTSIPVTKAWDDDGREDVRPDSVTVALLQDGNVYKTATVNAAGEWAYTFEGLPKYHDHGTEYAYTVEETGYYAGYVPATVTGDGTSGYTVTNTYDPYGDLTVSKEVTNATDASAGADHVFSITLTTPDGEPESGSFDYETSDGRSGTYSNGQTIALKGGQTLTIHRIPSEDTYEVTEAPASGYTQTAATGSTGTIEAGRTQAASFTNTYDTAGSVTLAATKSLSGRTLARFQFRFDVTDEDGNVLRSATNDADGSVTFGRIRYGLDDVGHTYTYHIVETDAGKAGYTYDSHVETVSVSVTDNGDGTITATPTYDSDGAAFANSYHAVGTTTVAAWKQLPGRALTDGEFEFQLVPQDGAPVKELAADETTVSAVAAGKLTCTSNADGTLSFPPLAFDETDAGNTYTYVASEVAGTDSTVTYTDETYTFTVRVQDDGDGTLSFDQTVDETPVFNNELVPGKLTIRKIVEEGKGSSNPNQEFTFHVKITLPDGSPLPDGTYTLTRSAIPDESSGAKQQTLTFDEDEDDESETTGTTSEGSGATVPLATITSGGSVLEDVLAWLGDLVSPVIAWAEPVAIFWNEYTSGTSVSISGQKLLDGVPADEPFTFELKDSSGNVLQTKTSGTGGGIAFDPISYTTSDSGQTYTYTVDEVAGTDATIDYDTSVKTVTVSLADDGEGNLSATTTYADSEGVVFRNTHKPGSLEITKAVTGTSATDVDFTVHVALSDGTTRDVTLRAGETETIDDLAPGTTYTVSETDLPDGYNLTSVSPATGTIASNQASGVTVTNAYAAEGSATLQATKVLEGDTLADGQFSFGLFEGGTQVGTATNGALGDVTFDPIVYTSAGTHDYTIREITQTSDEWLCDSHVATARVEVTDDGNGHLSTSVTYGTGASEPTFTNRPGYGELRLAKSWDDGTNPSPDHRVTFDLTLTDATGAALSGTTLAGGVYSGDTKQSDLSVLVTAGHATVAATLEEGQTVRLAVPRGTTYGVSEDTSATGYTVASSNTSGTIGASPSVASFANSYESSGTWVPTATKSFTGGTLVGGDFTFELMDDGGNVVGTATNAADGSVTFPEVTLDSDMVGESNAQTFAMREVAGDETGVVYDGTIHLARVWATDDGKGTLVAHAVWDDGAEGVVPAFENVRQVSLPYTGASGVADIGCGAALVMGVLALVLWQEYRRN